MKVRAARGEGDEHARGSELSAASSKGAARGAPPLVNLVFMGMGEPFNNLPEVLRAIRLLTDGRAYDFAPARVTVSTVGGVSRTSNWALVTPRSPSISQV